MGPWRSIAIAATLCSLELVFIPEASGAKILVGMTTIVNTVSQHMIFSSIMEPLVERGHEVVLLAPENKITQGLTEKAVTGTIFFKSLRRKEDMEETMRSVNAFILGYRTQKSLLDKVKTASEMIHMYMEGCIRLWEDRDTLERLKKERFDLIITMPVVGCDALLAEYLGIPFVAMTPVRRTPSFNEDLYGIPAPSSYVPYSVFTTFTDHMTFFERTTNVLIRQLEPIISYFMSGPLCQIQRKHRIRPDLSVRQLMAKAQLWLCQTHVALEYAQPTAPNYVAIGGITVKPSELLPQDMEEFIQGSGEDGVIVFTLGSIVSSLMDDDLTEKLAKVFSELPQRVLWRYKGARPRNLGNNTLIADWLPQNDLLGNPKTRLLIYHGGANGIYEAVSHGVPLLLMPLAVDQMSNAVRIEAKGMGFAIDKNTLTEEIFREAIQEMLHNPKYTINAKKASAIMKDEIVPVREKVVFYVEHILKFGGDHFRSRALKLNFIQRESIDVTLFLFSVFVAFLCSARWVICKCCCRRCGSTPTNTYKSKCD